MFASRGSSTRRLNLRARRPQRPEASIDRLTRVTLRLPSSSFTSIDTPSGSNVGVEHAVALTHLDAAGRGVIEQHLVEPRALDLPGLRLRDAAGLREAGVEFDAAVAGAERGAPLLREAHRAHLILHAERVERVVHGGEQRLADMKARKAVALEQHDAMAAARDHGGRAGPGRAAADDGDVVVER